MQRFTVERIERSVWTEGLDSTDYKEIRIEIRRVLHSSLDLEAAKEYVMHDSEYYPYDFHWDGWDNRSYVGYEVNEKGGSGIRYQIRPID